MSKKQNKWPPKSRDWQELDYFFEQLRERVLRVKMMSFKINSDDLLASIGRLPNRLAENLLSEEYTTEAIIPTSLAFINFFEELDRQHVKLVINSSGSKPKLCEKILKKALGALYQRYEPLIDINVVDSHPKQVL